MKNNKTNPHINENEILNCIIIIGTSGQLKCILLL